MGIPGGVPDGIEAHRRRVRRRGPGWALAAAAVPGGLAILLAATDGSALWQGAAVLALGLAAAPLLPVAGIPVTTGAGAWALGVVASALWWWGVGTLAARRATAVPGGSWPEWRSQYLRLAAGSVIGSWLAVALGAAVMAIRATA